MPPRADPQTEDNWTVHALNIHGEFFERWCAQIIREANPWRLVTTNYPVSVDAHQSTLDIRADADIGDSRYILLIECKKNNPEFVDWIFFPKHNGSEGQTPVVLTGIATNGQPTLLELPLRAFGTNIADMGRETRGDYLAYKQRNDKTKTSNSAITDASRQVALATEAIWYEERVQAEDRRQGKPSHGPKVYIVPLVVTTARLRLCQFNPRKVDEETGEISLNEAALTNPLASIVYEYPLPTNFQRYKPHISEDRYVRRHIIVVHSTKFRDFLATLGLDL